jgi:hypothetical protein
MADLSLGEVRRDVVSQHVADATVTKRVFIQTSGESNLFDTKKLASTIGIPYPCFRSGK